MDYTTIPRALIYRERRNVEEFAEEADVNSVIIDNMFDSNYFGSADAKSRVLTCFNTAYYLCTLILHCEKRPEWNFARFCDIACCDQNKSRASQAFTLSLVYIFLNNTYYENSCKKLLKKLEDFLAVNYLIRGDLMLKDYSFRDVCIDLQMNFTDDCLVLEEFLPRVIDQDTIHDVMKRNQFNWVCFSNYYEERTVRDIVDSLGQTPEEKHNVINMLRKAAHDFYSADNPYLETVNELLDTLDDSFCYKQKESCGTIISRSETEEPKNSKIIGSYEARIQELQKENAELREQNEQLQQMVKTSSDNSETKRLKEERTAMLMEMLKPAFYGDADYARGFLKEIDGRDNQGVTDVARQWLKNRKIVPSKKGRYIWSVLRTAKLYDATEQNWTAAMRKPI